MIKLSKCGCLARVKKQNEIIVALNPLLRIEMREGDKLQTHYSDNNVVLEIPNLDALSQALEAEASSHPWKATSNGDSTVAVAAGEVIALSKANGYPFYWSELSYAGGDIEVTAATGYIIISMVVAELNGGDTNAGDSGLIAAPSSIAVEFVTTMADVTDDFGYPICKVALTGGVATITKQILTHNPDPSVTWISPAP